MLMVIETYKSPHDRRRTLRWLRSPAGEIALVLLTGGIRLAVHPVPWLRLPFVLAAILAWTGYIVWRRRVDPGVLRRWGFGREHLRPALLASSCFGVPALALMLAYGAWAGRLPPPATFWVALLLYPAWGLIQQFLTNALIAGNLKGRLPAAAVIPLTALLFSAVHAPDLPLMGLTFLAGLAWVGIYLRHPNLWPLGIWHGVLGSVAYWALLGRQPWLELLAAFLPTG
jgi:hypothetical protein